MTDQPTYEGYKIPPPPPFQPDLNLITSIDARQPPRPSRLSFMSWFRRKHAERRS